MGGIKMTDRELLELLVSKFDSMENRLGTMESRFDSMETRFESRFDSMETKISSVETDVKEIKKDLVSVKAQTDILTEFREETIKRFDILEYKLDDIEAKNAERHVTMNSSIVSIKEDLSRVEINTAENWRDIAKMKAMKIAEDEDYK